MPYSHRPVSPHDKSGDPKGLPRGSRADFRKNKNPVRTCPTGLLSNEIKFLVFHSHDDRVRHWEVPRADVLNALLYQRDVLVSEGARFPCFIVVRHQEAPD